MKDKGILFNRNFFKKAFIVFTLLYVLFFVKTWGSVVGNIYSHDDVVYYAQTVSLVNDFDADIQDNQGPFDLYLGLHHQTNKMMSYQPLGPSLLYVPVYLLTKPVVYLSAFMRGSVFDEYDPLFFVSLCFFTVFLFFWSGVFLQKLLSGFFEKSLADLIAVFTLFGTIMPVYIFRRPIFGVAPEFFLVSFLLYLIAKIYKEGKVTIYKSMCLGLVFGLLVITRWNDIYILPFCLLSLAYTVRQNHNKKTIIKRIIISWGGFSSVAIIFFLLTQGLFWQSIYGSIGSFVIFYKKIIINYVGYDNDLTVFLFLKEYIKNFIHLIFGIDWGIIFTMPILLFGGISFIFNNKFKVSSNKIIHTSMLSLLFFVPFCVVLQWKNTGEFYGYRFLISLLPFSAFGLASLVEKQWAKRKTIIKYIIIGLCVVNFFAILPFELTDKTTLNIDNITPMGGHGWGNNYYFINAVKFYFTSDVKTFTSNFSRGYLGAFIFGGLYSFGVDLGRFSEKVKDYFSLNGYRQYISFLYFILIGLWFWLMSKRKDKSV
ncbi:MAG: hypothetical protein HQ538_05620 [Parcubacteria group bacterium]|nr:hypothetical protein [Parcubacteria group bacterium]